MMNLRTKKRGRNYQIHSSPDMIEDENRGLHFRIEWVFRRAKNISWFLVVAIALGSSNPGVVGAFSSSATSNGRPLAIAVYNRRRNRPWQRKRQEIENSFGHDFSHEKPRDTASTTSLSLFFNKRDAEGNFVKTGGRREAKPTDEILNKLRSPGISFPKTVALDDNETTLLLRYMTTDDLKALVPMCIREFGSKFSQQQLDMKENGNTKRQAFLPRWILDPKQIPDVWDGFSFEMLIYWTLRLKLIQGGNSRRSIPKHPKDPVMLVLCEQKQDSQYNTKISTPVKNDTSNSCIVGMIELSLQPPDADRNPPTLPLPLWYKAAQARLTTLDGSLQGWVTNVLIAKSSRGKGYSKVLMAAVEGIAKHQWGCNSIYLHADADIRSGKVPQSLYEGLGYDLVIGSTKKGKGASGENPSTKYAWAGVSGKELERLAAIRMLDGLPLLCYSKQL